MRGCLSDEFINHIVRQRIQQHDVQLGGGQIPLLGEINGFLHGAFGRTPGDKADFRVWIAIFARKNAFFQRIIYGDLQFLMALVAHVLVRRR